MKLNETKLIHVIDFIFLEEIFALLITPIKNFKLIYRRFPVDFSNLLRL